MYNERNLLQAMYEVRGDGLVIPILPGNPG
jgi:hypothetical protein